MASTRRNLLIALAATPLAGAALAFAKSGARRPRFGVQTYSFRDMLQTPGDMVDKMIAGCRAVGLNMIELFEPTIQPPAFSVDAPWAMVGGVPTQASVLGRPPEGPPSAAVLANREKIRQWRLTKPMSEFEAIGRRFRRAGIEVQAFNFSLKDDCTDAEVERGFLMTRALGTRLMTASTTLTMARRTVPFAERHKVQLGLHGHSNLRDPTQLATPESFEQGLAMSPLYRINLDIGHFSAAGFDPLAFLDKHAARICSVHLKDRKNHDGANMPFGEGDTPVAAFIRRVAERGYPIPLILEYEYAGGASTPQLRRMLDFARRAVA